LFVIYLFDRIDENISIRNILYSRMMPQALFFEQVIKCTHHRVSVRFLVLMYWAWTHVQDSTFFAIRSLIIFKLQTTKNDTQKTKHSNSNFDLWKKQMFIYGGWWRRDSAFLFHTRGSQFSFNKFRNSSK
jgi:hypothetical protein